MRLKAVLIFLMILLCAAADSLFAQGPDVEVDADDKMNAVLRDAQQVWEAQTRQQFHSDIDDLSIRGPQSAAQRMEADRKFLEAGLRFGKAVEDLKGAFYQGAPTTGFVKELDKTASELVRYLKSINRKAPPIDKVALKRLAAPEVLRTIVENVIGVDVNLRQAMSTLRSAAQTKTVPAELLRSFHSIHGDLLRLRAMVSRIKEVTAVH